MNSVFIVDDDSMQRRALATTMRSLGFRLVGEAGDGAAALVLLKATSADLIISDCQMPRMDGIAMTRKLRSQGCRTPIIMISGQTHEQMTSTAIAAGADYFVAKPISIELLRDAIRMVLPRMIDAA